MKKNFTFLLVALFAASVWAQTPDKVLQSGKYQRADVSAQISGHRAVGKASAVALKKRSERLLLDASSALPLAQQAGALAPQTASDDCPKITVSPGHPYREGFEDVGMFQLPECWSASLGTSFSGIFIYPKQFWSEIFIGVGQIEEGVQAAWISPANIGDITYMETPVFDITALSVPVLSFKYVLFNSNGKAEEFRVYYRGSQSDAWTPLPGMEFTAGNSTLNEWSNPSVALPAPSANYQLKFEITGQNAFGVGFDAVYIGDPDADCPTVAVTPTEPYREGFEYSKKIPECWTATTPANFQTKIIDGTDWAEFEVAPPIQEGEHTLWFSWGDAGAIGHIETPVFDITELNAPTLLFKYMLMEWEGRAEELRVYYRTSPSDAWALLPGMEFTADNSGLDLWFNASVALPATSATCQLKFEVTGMDAEGIAIDDIYIGEAVPCITPSALAVSNIGSDNADISWTSDAGMWNVIVSPVQITDFTSVTPTAQGLTAAWYHATELDAVKTYYVYVQSDCGADGKSDWALVTFRTAACNPEERCTYKVVTHDAFVDGWSGGTLSFVQNGDVVASVSNIVALNPQIFNIQLCDGIPVELVWDYGSWFEEVSFELLDISGNEIYAVAQG
ncbi:MAG: hypothetical protein LBS01_00730, partial [Prevotellaceae bacterium]|nr:hypothetical protein [Prevotellaceae bacterium]